MSPSDRDSASYDVVILGAGYAGLMAGLRLSAWTSPLSVLLVNELPLFTERVRLQECLAKPVAPRLPPLGKWLSETRLDFLEGRVTELHPDSGTATVLAPGGPVRLFFNRCIYALGSAIAVGATPGASDHAFRLDPGGGPRAAAALRERLEGAPAGTRVTVVGGRNTAVEAAAEIKAARPDFDVTMIASGVAGDFGKGSKVQRAVRRELERLGVILVDHSPVAEVSRNSVRTRQGQVVASDLCVWAGGLESPAIARASGLAVDEHNRIWVDGGLRSISHPRVIAIGDSARPIAPTGAIYRQSALAALASGAYAGASLLKEATGKSLRPFSFSAFGQGVAIGRSGVGFVTYPDDGAGQLVVAGRLALRLRNLFVRMLVWCLRLQRLWPGLSLFWIGRKRVSWDQAEMPTSRIPGRVISSAPP